MNQMSCCSWSRGAEPVDQVPVHQSHTACKQEAHPGCPWVYSRGSAKKKFLEWCANCLCSRTIHNAEGPYTFIRFFHRAVAQLLILSWLDCPTMLLKIEVLLEMYPHRDSLEGQLLWIQMPQAPPVPANLNSLLNSMLIPMGTRTTTSDVNFGRRISLVISGYLFNFCFLFSFILRFLRLSSLTNNWVWLVSRTRTHNLY